MWHVHYQIHRAVNEVGERFNYKVPHPDTTQLSACGAESASLHGPRSNADCCHAVWQKLLFGKDLVKMLFWGVLTTRLGPVFLFLFLLSQTTFSQFVWTFHREVTHILTEAWIIPFFGPVLSWSIKPLFRSARVLSVNKRKAWCIKDYTLKGN